MLIKFILSCLTISLIFSTPSLFATPKQPKFDKIELNKSYQLDPKIWNERLEVINGISNNLLFLSSPAANQVYQSSALHGFSQEQLKLSLLRFKNLLETSDNFEEFKKTLPKNFYLLRSSGRDGKGTVRFTGYYQPTLKASTKKTSEFCYPIYSKPQDLEHWPKPHPTRLMLEGYSGLGTTKSKIKGLELFWFSNRFDAFMAQLQGSALLELEDGQKVSVGYAAGTDYPFRGISKDFLIKKKLAWNNLGNYFLKHPDDLNTILARNNRFIFFKQKANPDPIGSLGMPVIAERSIATDKIKLPPAAIGLVQTQVPRLNESGKIELVKSLQVVLDQDTGSAIKGLGRVDIFMGSGKDAKEKASHLFSDGHLFYLVAKD